MTDNGYDLGRDTEQRSLALGAKLSGYCVKRALSLPFWITKQEDSFSTSFCFAI